MEKSKKSKKKLIGIIAGCAMAFVLTVVVSVAVTLAYFGDNKDASGTITMGQALKFGTTATASTTLTTAKTLPGASDKVTVSASIAQSTTTAYLRVKVASSGTGADSIVLGNTYTCTDGTFIKNGDYYYLAESGAITTDNDMVVLDATAAAGKAISFEIPYTVDAALKNEVAGQEITITVSMEIIQSEYVGKSTRVADVATAWNSATVG